MGAGVIDGSSQRVVKMLRGKHRKATFEVRLTNGGKSTDAMKVSGTSKNRTFKVTYLVGGHDVTHQVLAGTYRTDPLKAGESTALVITVVRTKAAGVGDRRTFDLQISSVHQQAKSDTVSAVVRIKG